MKYVYEDKDGNQYTVEQSMNDKAFETLSELARAVVEQQGIEAIKHIGGVGDPDSPVKRVVTGGAGFIWGF